MFRTRPDHRPETVQVFVEGRALMVPEGSSAAAAILISGLSSIRETPVSGSPRMPWCMMGACFDCLAEIDGVANRQACMVPVAAGMRIARQQGAREVRR
jgi:predicted molibdopterin-dependent oxidoreductase YjgC